jgi:hypothetical protein
MFIFKTTQKRANPYAPYTDANGVRYPKIPISLLTEIAEPIPPEDYSEDMYYRTEQDTTPYVVYTKKSAEQIGAITLLRAKQQRALAVSEIKVTTTAGNEFDGDEESQGRMARAITVMEDADTIPWVLADNTVVIINKAELQEALRLAGTTMASLWVSVY